MSKLQCYWASTDCYHAGSSYHNPRNYNGVRDKHWIGTFNFDRGFAHEESICQFRSEAAKYGAEIVRTLHRRERTSHIFFYSHGVMHHEYAPKGQTITKEYYQVLRCFRDAVWCNRLDLQGSKILAAPSWQRTSPFCAYNSGFLSQIQHSCGLSGSTFTWHDSVWLLAISQAENDAERDLIWVKRGHHTEWDKPANTIPITVFQEYFQNWQKC